MIVILLVTLAISQTTWFVDKAQDLDIIRDEDVGPCSFCDYNSDGNLDIFVATNIYEQNIKSRIYENLGGPLWQFDEHSDDIGIISGQGHESQTVFGDIDNDGDNDFFTSGHTIQTYHTVLYLNQNNSFSPYVTEVGITESDPNDQAAVLADFNNDGLLDIFSLTSTTVAQGLILNQHYINQGDTDQDGVVDFLLNTSFPQTGENNIPAYQHALGTTVFDYDLDGDLDIFVADGEYYNYLYLYKNNGSNNFVEIADDAGLRNMGDTATNTGISAGDYNNDGLFDLFVTRNGFPAGYNIFYQNTEAGFVELENVLTGSSSVSSRGGIWGDFNNDGYLDLFVKNNNNQHYFYINQGAFEDYSFNEISVSTSGINVTGSSFGGVCAGDYNNDGWLDILIGNRMSDNNLYVNHMKNFSEFSNHHYLKIKLIGTSNNRSAIGAYAKVNAGSLTDMNRAVCPGANWGQNDPTLHFGLGTNTQASQAEIYWPNIGGNGYTIETITNVNADITLTVEEGAPQSASALTLSGGQGEHPQLSWTASESKDVTGYDVYRQIYIDKFTFDPYVKMNTTPITSTAWEDENFTITTFGGTKARYKVQTIDITSQLSDFSNVVNTQGLAAMDQSEAPLTTADLQLKFQLHENYPNPFNPSTTFSFYLPQASTVRLEIFNTAGQLIETLINSEKSAGSHFVVWNASPYASGIYFYRLTAGRNTAIQKCMLVK